MSLFLAHILIAGLFFIIINWLGRHSTSFGYYSPSTIAAVDDKPAFNLLFRVLAPNVLLIFLCAIALAAGRLYLLQSIWRVTPMVFAIRWSFNCVLLRLALLHWPRQFLIATASSALSYLAYETVTQSESVAA